MLKREIVALCFGLLLSLKHCFWILKTVTGVFDFDAIA